MSTIGKESKYASVDELDNGHESDTTACSEGLIRRSSSPRQRSRSSNKSLGSAGTWLRWGSVIILQTGILVLLALMYKKQELHGGSWDVETGSDINGIFKTKSHRLTPLTPQMEKYMPNMDSDENRMEIRKNWDMLMPLGSGSVEIKDWRQYPLLGPPIDDDPIRNGSIYEASWTHALHCLYYQVDTYHQMVVHGSENVELNPKHASHCFEYLRNSIMCNLDMTLEGSPSVMGTEGDGQRHQCRNREEAVEWIESRRVDDIQDIVGS